MEHDSEKAGELFDDAVELVRRQRLRPALACLLEVLRHDPCHRDALASAGRLTRMLGDTALAGHLEQLSQAPDDPTAHYETGYALIDAGRPDLASVFLHECTKLAPQSDLVRHELGYALFRARRFVEAQGWLHAAWQSESLTPSEAIESGLLLVECLLFQREIEEASKLLDQVSRDTSLDDHQRHRADSLARLLGRARHLPSTREADLRDWHFVQHGGVILRLVAAHETRGAGGGRCLEAQPGYAFTAAVLKLAAGLLEDLGRKPCRVLAVSDQSVALASVLARLLDLPAEAYTGEEDGLVVVRTLDELADRQDEFVEHRDQRPLFAFCLNWQHDAIVLPEMTGILARHLVLPWETPLEVHKDSTGAMSVTPVLDPSNDLLAVTEDLLAAAQRVNVTEELRALRDFCLERRAALVLGNPGLYPQRFAFTAHSPIATSEHIFP